jgi:Fe2+ or Zn2+ uptake regulation protein
MAYTDTTSSILSILRAAKRPISATAIIDKISNKHKTTIYRQLHKLESSDTIRSIQSSLDSKLYYEMVSEHHSHFECVQCGMIECIADTINTSAVSGVVTTVKLEGLCTTCIPKSN